MFCRQRSTLIRLNFGPKDGEPLISRIGRDCRIAHRGAIKDLGL